MCMVYTETSSGDAALARCVLLIWPTPTAAGEEVVAAGGLPGSEAEHLQGLAEAARSYQAASEQPWSCPSMYGSFLLTATQAQVPGL